MRDLRVALISELFFEDDAAKRLTVRLREARSRGAELAVLPELPLNPWSPATTVERDEDAEPVGGPRHRALATAARDAGLGVVGGAIVRDPTTGMRHNTALIIDATGELVATYRKLHLPDEPGFHEACHYAQGAEPPEVITAFGFPLGVQICSDINRPEGSHLLAAAGAAAILNPRATEGATVERWKLVFRAVALTSTAYVLSVNRPGPEGGVALGGPSIAIDPNGEVLVESTEVVTLVTLEAAAVHRARRRYPGYLARRADVWARGWSALGR